jgi:hypothetical protein
MALFISYVPDEAIEKDAQALLAEYAHRAASRSNRQSQSRRPPCAPGKILRRGCAQYRPRQRAESDALHRDGQRRALINAFSDKEGFEGPSTRCRTRSIRMMLDDKRR